MCPSTLKVFVFYLLVCLYSYSVTASNKNVAQIFCEQSFSANQVHNDRPTASNSKYILKLLCNARG